MEISFSYFVCSSSIYRFASLIDFAVQPVVEILYSPSQPIICLILVFASRNCPPKTNFLTACFNNPALAVANASFRAFVSKEEIGMYIRAECDNLHSQFQKEDGMS